MKNLYLVKYKPKLLLWVPLLKLSAVKDNQMYYHGKRFSIAAKFEAKNKILSSKIIDLDVRDYPRVLREHEAEGFIKPLLKYIEPCIKY